MKQRQRKDKKKEKKQPKVVELLTRQETVTIDQFRTRIKEIPGIFVRMEGIGLVEIEPEAPNALYIAMERAGVTMNIPDEMRPEYDEDGEPIRGRYIDMSWSPRDMFANMPEMLEFRCCAITVKPKVVPCPRGKDEKIIPIKDRDTTDEFLYWDEIGRVNQRVLELALNDERISGDELFFRPQKPADPGDRPDS